LLTYTDAGRARLLVYKEPDYLDDLQEALNASRRRQERAADGVVETDWKRWHARVEIDVDYHERGQRPITGGDRLAVSGFLFLLLSGVMTCFAYFFASITSEKQARVTEQIVSAIPIQAWMDGKILGICALGLKSMLTLVLWAALAAYVTHVVAPDVLADLGGIGTTKILVGTLFVLLGLLFWGAFLAGIAATIDDPNNSTRSSVMLIPTIPTTLAFLATEHAGNAAVAAMSWIPITSMAFMPVRYALTDVAPWEVLGSAALLLTCLWWMRRFASRVFRAGMFLYGKEPSWGEILRWMRNANTGP
jgi:ABC-2 type transport system permease protein